MSGFSPAAAGSPPHSQDAWLHNGGIVVAASDRAARALLLEYHRRRRAEGLNAWAEPAIVSWGTFLRNAWDQYAHEDRMLLNPAQERQLWADIAGRESHLVTSLEGPLFRLASLAMEAHQLLCSYAPSFLRDTARSAWEQDAAAFSRWLTQFDAICRDSLLLSPSRIPLELLPRLQADSAPRPPLLLAGFDRILPAQQHLFAAWGEFHQPVPAPQADDLRYFVATDGPSELEACALWCVRKLQANPAARLLVVSQEIPARRGEIERAFLQHIPSGPAPGFEFSLGVPLSQIPFARAALLLLRWLSGAIEEEALDWLLSSGLLADPQESIELQTRMRTIRRHGLQQPQWTLAAFLQASAGPLPSAWQKRIIGARAMFLSHLSRRQTPLDWAELVPQLLQAAGLPGSKALTSAEYQTMRRWEQALDTCTSLGFDGRQIQWSEFLSTLSRALDETLFAPESADAPIQITGAAESAGLSADAIWFLGADEDTWPASGSTHPLIPLAVQRQAAMPHALPLEDWTLAEAVTTRLLAAAPVVRLSFASLKGDIETRPSRLAAAFVGPPQPLPVEMLPSTSLPLRTVTVQDFSCIRLPSHSAPGGSSLLTQQSQCPFKAFAIKRLGAQSWEPAEVGLTASQRGLLLHNVLGAIWAGPPNGISSRDDLNHLPDISAFVTLHVKQAIGRCISAPLRERLPKRYLQMEELRLIRLITAWLQFESARLPFSVLETEADHSVTIEGLTLNLRLDRVDTLPDQSLLVIDYKTGDVSPRAWDRPRPDDVQLPLYAAFALPQQAGGLVFAKVRTGEFVFAGQLRDARANLFANLNGNSALVRNKLTDQQMQDWKQDIEDLARDFLAGRADVDPREYPRTCERCDLQSVCRVQEEENRTRLESRDETDESEANNEEAAHA